jgi:hypothetical protein
MVARALVLPPEAGGGTPAGLVGIALAMRRGVDATAQRATLLKADRRYGAAVVAFLDSVAKGAEPGVSERLLLNVPVQARGYAYSAAIVLVGRKAPQAWRDFVQRMLFKVERPYFAV